MNPSIPNVEMLNKLHHIAHVTDRSIKASWLPRAEASPGLRTRGPSSLARKDTKFAEPALRCKEFQTRKTV